jgi:nucleotide-binding universal stress UspA family protein
MTATSDRAGGGVARPEQDGGGRQRVVVGVDGSPGSRSALRHALLDAARRGADLEVVCSYQAQEYYLGESFSVPVVENIPKDTEARTFAVVAEVQDELAASVAPGIRDVQVTVVASGAPPVAALLERSEGAALLVVGSRGRGAMRSALLGSVALHCVTHASCPVEVVHSTAAAEPSSGRVVVGVDGSEGSRAALAAAVDEAVRRGAEVEAVVTYRATDFYTDPSTVTVPTVAELRSGLEAGTGSLVQEVLADGREPGGAAPIVRIVAVEGPAREVLVDRARSADLLVVGSRGRGAFRALLLGSTALHCAMHAPCPVQVVHPQPSRTTAPA